MSSFKCSGCGRTDFFTSHGFAKHGQKCGGSTSDGRGSRQTSSGAPSVPAWEKVRGTMVDASSLSLMSGDRVVNTGPWTVYAYPSDYNSRHKKNGQPYVAHGSGPMTWRQLQIHANKVTAHAEKQDAARFFEFFKVSRQSDGSALIVMLFGS